MFITKAGGQYNLEIKEEKYVFFAMLVKLGKRCMAFPVNISKNLKNCFTSSF